MSDHEIHGCIDQKVSDAVKSMERFIDSYTSTITRVITGETQDIRHSIDELTKRVDKQNGSVRDLKEWRAKVEGKEMGEKGAVEKNGKKLEKILQVIGVIVAISSLFLIYRRNESRRLNAMEESIKAEVRARTQPGAVTRNGSLYDPISGRVYFIDSTSIKEINKIVENMQVR